MITFGSECSGIESASVAFEPLGWKAAWFAEIEPFPSAVLAHHYPEVPNLGDMTTISRRVLTGEVEAPDVVIAGTPCQAFSVAGNRKSLDDDRGNLTLKYVESIDAIDFVRTRAGKPACVAIWENVPGVLSTIDNAFGCFLAGLAGEDVPLVPPGKTPRPGEPFKWANAGAVYGPQRAVAWRTLDAQYFGLAQRRRRVFVVASAREGFDPATVLFEWNGVRRDTAPSRETREEAASTLAGGARARGGYSTDDVPSVPAPIAGSLTAGMGRRSAEDPERGLLAFGGNDTSGARDVATALSAHGGTGRHDFESETFVTFDTTQMTSEANRSNPKPGDPCHPLAAGGHPPAIAFDARQQDVILHGDRTGPLDTDGWTHGVRDGVRDGVRRLTPVECERLQGFRDGYTQIPWDGWRKMDATETPEGCRAEGLEIRQTKASGRWYVKDVDGPRYKALGNSKAVPVVRWIGRRVQAEIERVST
jgi:DNA (cytosine-5)-methyltransferase 1